MRSLLRRLSVTLLFSLAAGLGAYLVFVLQPQIGKLVLPLLGGTPGVWNTCIVFFQLALLAGYLYAHLLGRLPLRAQAPVHLVLMLAAATLLPIRIGSDLEASTSSPVGWLFVLLTLRAGAPFFALAATAPLVQRWLSYTRHPDARDPYFLYSASNVGSLLALLTYPALVEPALDLGAQSVAWAFGYGMLLVVMAGVAAVALREQAPQAIASDPSVPHAATPLGVARRARWIALSAVPSSLLLSVTTYLTTDVAAVPLLWVVPLSVYLITFILAFARRTWIPHRLMCLLLPVAVMWPLLTLVLRPAVPLWLMLGHLVTLFIAAMVCHGKLARDRPEPERLTEFYLWLSVGGALGGLFNVLVAPLVFDGIAEYPLGLIAACLLRPGAPDAMRAGRSMLRDAGWAVASLAAALAADFGLQRLGWPRSHALGIPVLAAMTQWPRARRYGLLIGVAFLAAWIHGARVNPPLASERGFFGVVRVQTSPDGKYVGLTHGNIQHGMQPLTGALRCDASYYGPVREAFETRGLRASTEPRHVGVVGLGIGTLIACGAPDEQWRFYEINPDVVKLATDPRYFLYLSSSPVPHDIVVGEGRLAVAREPTGRFDILVLDAFTSDAIPMHLVTRDAIEIYRTKLAPRGILLVNISNRYVDLTPVLGSIAEDLGMLARLRRFVPTREESERGTVASDWIVLARDTPSLSGLAEDPRWTPLPASTLRPWTDAYSSLLSVIRWTEPRGS
jgi:hypothetical protein